MEYNASTFKTQCLKLLDMVERHGTELVVTKRGRPVARVIPYKDSPVEPLLGSMRGAGEAVGDIVSPTTEEWALDE